MFDNEPIQYSIDDGVVTIAINRPERKNALSVEAMNGLTDAWERVEKDSRARAVILTSADCGVFSAGMDLKQAAVIRARDGVDILTLVRDPLQTAMRAVSKPIIAAMTGSLMAGGMLLALKCDLRVGLRGTRAGITEVKMGRATAIEMARCGARIAVLGRRTAPIEDTAKIIREIGGNAIAISADIRMPNQIENAMLRIKDEFGQLDILVNNAGGQFVTPARELNNKGFETVIRNNLIGSWQMTKAAADYFMLEHGGSIVFVTACVRSGLSGFVHTAAARGGVLAMMKTLAFEWAEFGIRLNCVAPGTIKTEGMGHYPIEPEQWLKLNRNVLGHMGDVEDISAAIIFLSSPLGKFVTGEEWYIDGGETLHLAHDARQMIDAVKFSRREPAVVKGST